MDFIKRIFKKKDHKSTGRCDKSAELTLSKNIDDNLERLKDAMNNSFDIKSRKFNIGNQNSHGAIMYIENLVNEDVVLQYIIKPLTVGAAGFDNRNDTEVDFKTIKGSFINTGDVEEAHTFDKIILAVLSGSTLVLIEGYKNGLLMSTQGYVGRSIEETKTEPAVKGPKEGFVENLKDNIGLIRKRLRDPNLTFESYKVGRRSKSDVIAVYIKGIVDEDIVNEVRKRIKSIDIDDGVTTAQFSHLLNDRPNSIFPLIQTTERPDKVVSSVLEGRVAVILEGTPGVLVVPVSMPILMQSVDDYYEQWILGTLIRLGRYTALFISALLPALYIAVTSFNPGILPTVIALSITGTRTGVPFPAFIEAFLMTATLELLIEAGIRLPKVVGQTVSIVGGLVIGQSAVQAGVISPVMVIVIAITAISSFAIPDYSLGLATRVLRIPFMISAAILGTFGTSIMLLALLGYTCSLESFGVGYLEPVTPYRLRDWKDTMIRGPHTSLGKRPEFLNPEDTQKQITKKEGKPDESKE